MTVQNPSSILPRGDSGPGPGLTGQFSEKVGWSIYLHPPTTWLV